MINVFLINLDKETERLKFVDKQLKDVGVFYQRISAVYGKLLSEEEKNASVNKFRCWCAYGQMLRDGEIGCGLSHYGIYRKMINENLDAVCVLEDDVILEGNFKEQLEYAFENIDRSRPQVFLLSNHTREVSEIREIRKARTDMFTEGYIITRPAAELLLRVNYPMIVPCDHWGRWVKYSGLELFHVFPTVCSQNNEDFGSDTLDSTIIDVSKMSLIPWVIRKSKRLVGCLIDRMIIFFQQ
jgi:glycosyl transferase family 25